jgi:hypothetical protein
MRTHNELIEILKRYNEWRRGAYIPVDSRADIGLAIDYAIDFCRTSELKIAAQAKRIDKLMIELNIARHRNIKS